VTRDPSARLSSTEAKSYRRPSQINTSAVTLGIGEFGKLWKHCDEPF